MSAATVFVDNESLRITRRDYTATTRLWGLCLICRCTWQWSGQTRWVDDGMQSILKSSCYCTPQGVSR